MRRTIWTGLLLVILLLAFASLAPVRADFGINWTGEFFPNPDVSGPSTTTVTGINGVNFNWGIGKPVVNGQTIDVGPETFSVRFTSTQTFTQGLYNFVVSYDDGARLIVDGQTLFDEFNGNGNNTVRTNNITRDMTAGNHTLVVDYFDGTQNASIQVQWFLQGTSGITTTPGVFATAIPAATAVPPLTVSVTTKGLSLRTGPYLGASFIGVARPGTAYVPTARNNDEGRYTWYRITVGERTGWVSGRYLEIVGDPNSVPQTGTVFDQIDGAPDLGVAAVPRAFMNFRRRPSQRAAAIGMIPWGDVVQIIGRTRQGGSDFWYQVRWNGQVGWIFAPFIRVDGDINLVPI